MVRHARGDIKFIELLDGLEKLQELSDAEGWALRLPVLRERFKDNDPGVMLTRLL